MLLHKNYNHQNNVSLPDLEQNTKQMNHLGQHANQHHE